MSRSQQGFDASLRRLSISRQQPSRTLRSLRIEAALSQRELGRRADVAPNTVRNAERGHIPLTENQERIAAVLSSVLKLSIGRYDLWPLVDEEAA